ncbi:NYN domain-containing protein [Aeromonas media]|uniref:NYN domain-containing protein n=1 Tax=Aeromonas media TaxID=651 RepID=UPI002280815A|nr:NYN domain-containing protein [Aeromonas media]MCY9822634.1 NYN domain-containing protein [Aeromonas media]
MAKLLYVDNSNVWIEGKHVAAAAAGMASSVWEAVQNNICDNSWAIDFGKLFQLAGGQKSDVRRAVLFGSKPTEKDSLWAAAKKGGFEVITYDRNARNTEKKVDTDIVTNMLADSYEIYQPGDEITLVAGDGDYVPAIERLKKRGIHVNVVFWSHASRELKSVASTFFPLDTHLTYLKR